MKEITDLEMCERLIEENQLELSKCKLMDRLHNRLLLSGENSVKTLMSANQAKLKSLKTFLGHFKAIHQTIVEENKKIVDNKSAT